MNGTPVATHSDRRTSYMTSVVVSAGFGSLSHYEKGKMFNFLPFAVE